MCRRLIRLASLAMLLAMAGDCSADLIAHLGFDEGSGSVAHDTSGNGHDGTLNGDPQWVAGRFGGALEFDGTDDYVEIPRVVQDDFTLAAWIKTDTPGVSLGSQGYQGSGLIWSDTAGVANDFILAVLGTKLSFFCGNPDTSVNSDTDVVTGEWVHVAATRSAQDRKIAIYINGEHENTIDHANTGPLNAIQTIAIGGNVLDSRYYTGLIDDVRLYDHVLLPAEILGAMEGQVWPFALGPNPEDGAVLEATWVNLSWTPGGYAVSHDVYLSDNLDAVSTGAEEAFRGNQASTMFIVGFAGFAFPEGLVPGTTYYWRIDEVNDADPNSPWKGDLWSFWVPPKKAYEAVPADGAQFVLTDVTLEWTGGFNAKLHTVYFGGNFDEVSNASGAVAQTATTFTPGVLESDKTYYWRVDEFDPPVTHKGDVWSFTTVPEIPIADPNLVGWWKLDEGGGTTAVDWSGYGNNGTFQGNPQWVDGLANGGLELNGTTDYVDCGSHTSLDIAGEISIAAWTKVDVFGDWDGIVTKGTTQSPYAMQMWGDGALRFSANWGDPAGGVGSGSWNTYTKMTAGEWTHAAIVYDGSVLRFYINGQKDSLEVFEALTFGTAAESLVLGGDFPGGDEYFDGVIRDVRVYNKALIQEEIVMVMRGDPLLAWNPSPTEGSTPDINSALPLTWSPGEKASQHDVYFGTDADTVRDADASDTTGVYRGRQSGTSFTPAEGVEWGAGPFYWRVDEINTDQTVTKGRVWSFTVADFLVVDDFEAYNDIDEGEPGSNRIYLTWIDGYGTTTNGAIAGNLDVPLMAPGHNSAQAMPVSYDNAGKTSEVTRTLTSTEKDWTEQGVTKLVLWFSGDAANAPDRMFVALGNAIVYHPDDAATQDSGWNEWVIDLQEFDNQGADLTNVGSITIGFGTRNAPVATGGTGTVDIDDIRLIR
ncbi:MAG: LamG domain-containing protein [Phycisphaerales bacterium]|nr:MAG: LamG domain-containing protein [Phycisphaerales bacterium]